MVSFEIALVGTSLKILAQIMFLLHMIKITEFTTPAPNAWCAG